MRAVFTTHDVVAKGSGLASLLSDLAAQQVTTLSADLTPRQVEQLAKVVKEVFRDEG